ncbi:MAG: AzlC family ABC transporter permease [Methanomassiliicoccales archaeon]
MIEETNTLKTTLSWQQGVIAALPIAAGYIPIAIAFGLTANAAQVPLVIAQGMSLMVFAGASQFMAIQMIMAGAGSIQIIMATFILNLRHLLMSASLAERIEAKTSLGKRALIAFGITDESFAVATLRPEQLSTGFVISVNLVAFIAWNLGTAVGLLVASGLPEAVRQSLGIALYAMFIGLLIPAGMKWRPGLVIAGLAAVINSFFLWIPVLKELGTSWGIIIATIMAAGLGTCLPSDKEVA